eukprot:TRINITY_DN3633_c0_g1_i9.p1 TRINITY_DN3633_c0_g1~~TRINITY_DN3633_c0_g1_i9.p1  ORF type:complete len:143 (-),score=40.59 TRINITY_DN3633_c0_g1_i9:257-685(-)
MAASQVVRRPALALAAMAAVAALLTLVPSASDFVTPGDGRRAAILGAAMPFAASVANAPSAMAKEVSGPKASPEESWELCWNICQRIVGPVSNMCMYWCDGCSAPANWKEQIKGLDEGDSIFKLADIIALKDGKALRAYSPW